MDARQGLVAILRDAAIEIGCCRFRHLMPKSGKPDFGGRSSG
jgi:hypothetical protein